MGGKQWLNNKGFTLTEAIMLVAIVAIFLSAILPFTVENLTANARAKRKLLAYQAVRGKVEDLRKQTFSTIVSGSFQTPAVPGGSGQVTVSNDINGDASPETDILKVKVDVYYTEKGQTKTVTLTTFITKNGVSKNE